MAYDKIHTFDSIVFMEGLTNIFFCFLALLCVLKSSTAAVDFISVNQTIRDGETLASADDSFEMGFFSPSNSTSRYFGIWYKKVANGTVVWVANREAPITDTSGLLTLSPQGVLGVLNSNNTLIWSSNSSGTVRNPVAQLLDTGNLVIRESNDENLYIWESFDFPGDTFLPGQKLGRDLVKGTDWYFVQSRSDDDPSPGNASLWTDTDGFPQLVWKRDSLILFRDGPWNGIGFSSRPTLRSNPIITFGFVHDEREIYFYYNLINSSLLVRLYLAPYYAGLQTLIWIQRTQEWSVYWTSVMDICDRYSLCGVYGSCNIDTSPPCECLGGFEPSVPGQWNVDDWSQGCRRMTALDCGGAGDGFQKYTSKKLPDTQHSWYNLSMNLDECEQLCKNNCACTAYANADISRRDTGCILWFGDLLDIRDITNGQDVYIRMTASEADPVQGKGSKVLKRVRVAVPIASALVILMLYVFWRRRKMEREGIVEDYENQSLKDDLELPLFPLSTLLTATTNFSLDNKLGEGGFGPVYKGVLEDGQEIAVKRLSKTSTQGLEEFKNEVICISKLQHRNLVKLLGCCIQGEEKMLVYEYMANKDLDSFIFDETQSRLLDWPIRWQIINGIARGLLYLHQDSRLRIIHRDLKAKNVLLDSTMNPKISDFGTARSFGGNETEANTNRVIGTYGYMSPEYARDGIFSVKSDVFSFGVLVLEILSGKRNRGFSHQAHTHNLVGHAWRLYQEGKSLVLVDASLGDSMCVFEMLRSIQLGLLCVQHDPEDRPTISNVVRMLGSEGALPKSKHPGFYTEQNLSDYEYQSRTYATSSTNELTLTMLSAR